jgi:hypothetical protein
VTSSFRPTRATSRNFRDKSAVMRGRRALAGAAVGAADKFGHSERAVAPPSPHRFDAKAVHAKAVRAKAVRAKAVRAKAVRAKAVRAKAADAKAVHAKAADASAGPDLRLPC